MNCPICNGKDCDDCDDGIIKIEQCPLEYIGYVTCKYIKMVEMFDKGLPPIAGGVLDQSHKFISIAEFVWACEARAKESENKKRNKK